METYVRTDNQYKPIIKITEKGCFKEFNGKLFAFIDVSSSYRYENGRLVIKQSENLEDLMDEFVGVEKRGDFKPCFEEDCFDSLKEEMKKYKANKKDFNIYGAIWLDKGLIYVARLNKNGEWEMIS